MVVADPLDGVLVRYGIPAMMTCRRLLLDESGFILSTESVLLGTLVVLGLIVGLAEVRNAVVQELGDYSQAVAWLSQTYEFTSVTSSNVADILSSGSVFIDSDDDQMISSVAANGILVDEPSIVDDE